MIFLLVGLVIIAIVGLLELLPEWTPVNMSGAVADLTSGPGLSVFAGLGWLNNYVPVDTMLEILGLQLVIWASVYVVRWLIWLAQKFHIAGGGDT